MRNSINQIIFTILFSSLPFTSAFAVDLDDDLKPDEIESIAYSAKADTTTQSAQIEAKFPDEAREIRSAIERHITHANTKDLEGYLGDFLKENVRYPKLDRDYAKRAMALQNLVIEVHSIEFQKLTRTHATVHTRQISRYIDASGSPHVDDVILSYRWIKDATDQVWRIAFTERRRLVASP